MVPRKASRTSWWRGQRGVERRRKLGCIREMVRGHGCGCRALPRCSADSTRGRGRRGSFQRAATRAAPREPPPMLPRLCRSPTPRALSAWIHRLHRVSIRLSKLLPRSVSLTSSVPTTPAQHCGIEPSGGVNLRMFHAFQMYVSYVWSGCCMCFARMSQK
jgi:hypothetical protein